MFVFTPPARNSPAFPIIAFIEMLRTPGGPARLSLHVTQDVVRRTAIGAGHAGEIRPQPARREQRRVGVVGVELPTHHVVDPVEILLRGDRLADAVGAHVVRQGVIVIAGIKLQRQPELSQVVQAISGLPPGFGARQRGEGQAGQDGNDRDDDQHFDQRESLVP